MEDLAHDPYSAPGRWGQRLFETFTEQSQIPRVQRTVSATWPSAGFTSARDVI